MSISLAIRATRSRGPARRLWRAAWLISYVLQMPARIALLLAAVARHGVFILSSDTWVHRRLDLPLLRLLRKRIILVFTGSDHRPPYLDGWFGARESTPAWSDLARATRRVRQRVATAERYADEIVALPASAHFHTKPIIDFLRVGIPFALPATSDAAAAPGPFRGEGVRVLHSPSNPVGKGSDLVRAAIEQLRAAGHAIDYVEIAGRPHSEVLAALRDCDFVVDEVFSDTPMASFATEAATFGKPAVVTGYYAELIADELPPEAIPPSLFEMPDKLTAAIERLLVDEPFRLALGARAQAFVSKKWNPVTVAGRYLRIIDAEVPDDWRWDPARQRYLYGWGMHRELVASTVRGLVASAGPTVLQLSHNPAVDTRLRDLASAAHGDRPPTSAVISRDG
ncbi:MAG: hypothetical protein ABI841_00515 [Chloroflexota bacterium]